jgi:hypothetical protein
MSPTAEQSPQPIEVRTRFERFPLAMKGALVLRAGDGNPHAVRILEGALARIPSGPHHRFPLEDRLIDVAPNRDLFVPFEASVAEVRSGWYVISSSIEVDGGRPLAFASRPFTIPWPQTDVRRGTVRLDRSLDLEGQRLRIQRVEMGSDSATVTWRGGRDRGRLPTISLVADGRALDVLPPDAGATSGQLPTEHEEWLRTYPVPRSARSLEVVVRIARGPSASVPVPLL